jgi:small-conductance mechanosensitive channel
MRHIFIPLVVAGGSALLLLVARMITVRFLHARSQRREGKSLVSESLFRSLSVPSIYWCLAIGLYVGMAVSDLPEKYIFYVDKTIHVILILSVSLAAANLTVLVFNAYVQRLSIPVPTTGLVSGVLKGTVIAIGSLITLSVLGISIAPLLTALGVGGLAVALALQDTLANLFAGFHILLEKSVRVGDFVKIESGQEGYVEDITWRTTRIRMLSNSMVLIPNRKLAQSVVVNHSLPDKRLSLTLPIRTGYSSDIDRVESLIIGEARKASEEVPGLVSGSSFSVSFSPQESWLEFTLAFEIGEFAQQYRAQDELKRRIFKRFQQEGIEIPFPARAVYMRETDLVRKDPP